MILRSEEIAKLLEDRGIAYSHRIPPVGVTCVSDRRRREMMALVGGGTKAIAALG